MRRFFLLAAFVALLGLAACGQQVNVVSLDASWAGVPANLHSLKNAADLVIRGRIASLVDVTTDEHGTPYTDFNVSVTTALHSKVGQPGAAILLHQTGALEGNTLYQISDDPLFSVGEQVILFLHQYAPGRYFVLGGPEGRFEIGTDGRVRPINEEGVHLAPTPEATFEDMLADA